MIYCLIILSIFILIGKKNSHLKFSGNITIRPHSFSTNILRSDTGISEIIADLNTLLPQLANFVNQFNSTVSQSGISVITDSVGNMSIDVPQNMSDDTANKISNRISIIDRLINTRGQEINDLLQKGINLEKKLKAEDSNYVSQLTYKIEEFNRLNSSYKH